MIMMLVLYKCRSDLQFVNSREEKKCCRPAPKKAKKSSEYDAACLYCGDFWSSFSEAFIQCRGKCNEWAHVSCARVKKKGKEFHVRALLTNRNF
jgi:hypothetical protein